MDGSIAAVKSSSETDLRPAARRQDSRFIDEIGEDSAPREARVSAAIAAGIDVRGEF